MKSKFRERCRLKEITEYGKGYRMPLLAAPGTSACTSVLTWGERAHLHQYTDKETCLLKSILKPWPRCRMTFSLLPFPAGWKMRTSVIYHAATTTHWGWYNRKLEVPQVPNSLCGSHRDSSVVYTREVRVLCLDSEGRAFPTRAEQSGHHSFISALQLDETPSCPTPAFVYSVGSWVGSLGFKNGKPSFLLLGKCGRFLIDIKHARLPWLGKLNVSEAPSV